MEADIGAEAGALVPARGRAPATAVVVRVPAPGTAAGAAIVRRVRHVANPQDRPEVVRAHAPAPEAALAQASAAHTRTPLALARSPRLKLCCRRRNPYSLLPSGRSCQLSKLTNPTAKVLRLLPFA